MGGMGKIGIRVLAASFTAALVWPQQASAQDYYHWYATKSGCQVWGDENDFGPGFTWSGKCNASNHIEGQGTLAYYSPEGKVNVEYIGEFIDGRPHGPFQYNAFVGDDAWPSPYHKVNFQMGCWLSSTGQPNADCVAASGKGKVATSPAPVAAPAPAPAAPANLTADEIAFQSTIRNSTEDQLVSLISELLVTKDLNLATIARTALMQRFPNSPLIPEVAKLFAEAAKPSTAAVAAPASPAPATPAPATRQRVALNTSQDIINAFAKFGVGMVQAESAGRARESHNYYDAQASDCVNDRCNALQLKGVFKFDTLPTYNLVQSWNLDMLYGRAYINGDRVHFDMVLPIPADGVELKTLEEFVATYKVNVDRFYDTVKPR